MPVLPKMPFACGEYHHTHSSTYYYGLKVVVPHSQAYKALLAQCYNLCPDDPTKTGVQVRSPNTFLRLLPPH